MRLSEYYNQTAEKLYNPAKEFSKDDPRYDECMRMYQRNMEICNMLNVPEYREIEDEMDAAYSKKSILNEALRHDERWTMEERCVLLKLYDTVDAEYWKLSDKAKAYREKIGI